MQVVSLGRDSRKPQRHGDEEGGRGCALELAPLNPRGELCRSCLSGIPLEGQRLQYLSPNFQQTWVEGCPGTPTPSHPISLCSGQAGQREPTGGLRVRWLGATGAQYLEVVSGMWAGGGVGTVPSLH